MDTTKGKKTSRINEINDLWNKGGLKASELDSAYVQQLTPKELGELGEVLAMSYLSHRGYEILEHHYRCVEGEADVVALDQAKSEVVLVEVKTRRVKVKGEGIFPEEAVDKRKCRRYRRIASCFLMDRFPVYAMRFDVLGIEIDPAARIQVKHYFDVFDWGATR